VENDSLIVDEADELVEHGAKRVVQGISRELFCIFFHLVSEMCYR